MRRKNYIGVHPGLLHNTGDTFFLLMNSERRGKRYSNVLVRSGSRSGPERWVGKLLFLCQVRTPGPIIEEDYGFIPYYECRSRQNAIEESLGRICLLWVTSKSHDDTINSQRRTSRNIDTGGECFVLIPIPAVEENVHSV